MQGRLAKLCALIGAAVALPPAASALEGPQDALEITTNDGFDAPGALKFDWPMVKIGTGQYEAGPTGVTVFRFGRKVAAAVDVRGGGPGTVNAAYLQLGYRTPELDAVVLSGGSWYGLETVTAVNAAMKDDGERGGAWDNIGLAVGSIIYDFGGRRLNEIYPDKRLAQAALRSARTGTFPVGAYGAGRSAMTGGLFGCNARSGQGAAYRRIGQLKIAVFTVVNALGVVTDRNGRVMACHRGTNWPQDLKASDLLGSAPDSMKAGWGGPGSVGPERKNTTISLVVTNRVMDPAELQRVATQVHTSMARAIQPFATELDGDVLYAVSTGEYAGQPGDALISAQIGTLASELMWDAVLSSVPTVPAAPARTRGESLDPASLRRLPGDYKFSEFAVLNIAVRGRRLFARATGERPVFGITREAAVELLAMSPDEFVVPGRYPLILRFAGDSLLLNPGRWQQAGIRMGGRSEPSSTALRWDLR